MYAAEHPPYLTLYSTNDTPAGQVLSPAHGKSAGFRTRVYNVRKDGRAAARGGGILLKEVRSVNFIRETAAVYAGAAAAAAGVLITVYSVSLSQKYYYADGTVTAAENGAGQVTVQYPYGFGTYSALAGKPAFRNCRPGETVPVRIPKKEPESGNGVVIGGRYEALGTVIGIIGAAVICIASFAVSAKTRAFGKDGRGRGKAED